jgi:methyl-accepting chemotaxis protein
MRWTIQKKLTAGFIATAALAGALGWVASRRIEQIVADMEQMTQYNRDIKDLAAMQALALQQVQAERRYLLSGDAAPLQTHAQLGQAIAAWFEENLAEARKTGKEIEIEALPKLAKSHQEYATTFAEITRLVKERKLDAAIKLSLTDSERESAELAAELRKLTAAEEKEAVADAADAHATASASQRFVLWAGGFAMLAALLLGYFIARMITAPLSRMVDVAGMLAEGKLDQQLDYRSQDELGTLADAFRGMIAGFKTPVQEAGEVLSKIAGRDLTARMKGEYRNDFSAIKESVNLAAEQLSHAMSEVRQSADQVAITAQQLSSASEEISSGAQEQASSLEETTATLEQLTSTVRQNAENARQANQLAAGSRDSAGKGGQVVSTAVTAMGEINEASRQIADIITTIDEIAFQTNLLALNAAVEAARAGEQGRGFAVVATEVRNLAQRSATAAREIKALIQNSVRKVENGSELVNRSGQTLEEIVGSVKRVTDIVSEIAAASQEQSVGIEQVAKAMTQMDQVTQANSSQTEELSSNAEELSATAEQLQALVAQFVLDREVQETAARPARRSAKAVAKNPARSSGASVPARELASLAAATSGPGRFEEF